MTFSSLDDLRLFGARLVLGLLWLIGLIACAAAATQQPHWQGLAATAIGIAFAATIVGRGGSAAGRLLLSALLMAEVSVLVAAHNGNAWQIDMHMTYFAALAIVSVMCDWRAIVAATLVVALHHLTLSFLLPALVFPGDASLGRVIVHAVILGAEAGALVWSSLNIAMMFGISKEALDKAETALTQAETASAELQRAQQSQKQVVAAISQGMRRLSEGDLEAAIVTPFPGDYERLRADFNDTVSQLRTAREAEAAGRAAEERARHQRAEEQNLVVSRITDGMGRLSQGDFDVEISDTFPQAYDALRVNFNAAASQLRAARIASLDAGKAQEEVVRAISTAMNRLAAGDLTVAFTAPFPNGYEQVRADLNAAFAALRRVFSDVVGVAQSIRKGAADLSQSAVDLTRRSGEQAATVEETAAALNEITQGVQRTAKLGDAVMNSISAAREHSERSNSIAADVVGAVEEIADSSNQIARINGVIRDIAFQTNLLALNAGVEAARAGEAGRGFAIVAQEVGALANRAAEAAKEINTLVESSKGSVEKGVELVTRSGQYVAEVIDKIGEVEKVAAAISRATAEQAATLGHVNQSVGRIDSATQQNAAMSENTQNSSASLSQNADALNEAIGRFKVGDSPAARRAVA